MKRQVSININGHLPRVIEALSHSVALHELLVDVEMAIDQHIQAAGDMRCCIILPNISIDIEIEQRRCN